MTCDVDINECTQGTHTCTQSCTNTEGSFQCACNSGFLDVNGECTDIDECLVDKGGCNQLCENSPGSFKCECFAGYLLEQDDQFTCVEIARDKKLFHYLSKISFFDQKITIFNQNFIFF